MEHEVLAVLDPAPRLVELLRGQVVPGLVQAQLDVFADSRDVGLRNDLAQALLGGDVPAAQRATQRLRAEFGNDAVPGPAAVLLEDLRAQQAADTPGAAGRRLDANPAGVIRLSHRDGFPG